MRKGIDVSSYQGKIDWDEVKDYIDFAIIRCGFGNDLVSQDDSEYRRNAEECARLKIPFGTYLFSYATDLRMIESEVKHTLRLVKDKKLEYPIFLDVEERTQLNLPKEKLTEIVSYYCKRMEDEGYYVGIYASLDVLNTKLDSSELAKYDKWVAEWNKDFTYKHPSGLWQYTDNGRIPGIPTRVDEDRAFYDYPKIIRDSGLNHLGDSTSLKYKTGDTLYLNGSTYKSEDGLEKLKTYKNKKVKIIDTSSDESKSAPYKLNIGGYAREEDLTVERENCFFIIKWFFEKFRKNG